MWINRKQTRVTYCINVWGAGQMSRELCMHIELPQETSGSKGQAIPAHSPQTATSFPYSGAWSEGPEISLQRSCSKGTVDQGKKHSYSQGQHHTVSSAPRSPPHSLNNKGVSLQHAKHLQKRQGAKGLDNSTVSSFGSKTWPSTAKQTLVEVTATRCHKAVEPAKRPSVVGIRRHAL